MHNITLEQQLDEFARSTIILSANLPDRLVKVLSMQARGGTRVMSVNFSEKRNRVTFCSYSINSMYPLFKFLRQHY